MATKPNPKPRVSNREWLVAHQKEYDDLVKSLGYSDPTPMQTADIIAYLRKNTK